MWAGPTILTLSLTHNMRKNTDWSITIQSFIGCCSFSLSLSEPIRCPQQLSVINSAIYRPFSRRNLPYLRLVQLKMLTHHCVRVRVTPVCSVYEEEKTNSVQFFPRTLSISIVASGLELQSERTTINARQGRVLLTVACALNDYTKSNVIIKRCLLHRDVFVLQSRKKRKLTMKIETLCFRFLSPSLSLSVSLFSPYSIEWK